ncbi:MAG TPA: CHAT domain-containing protein, partial [Kribbella sp.]
GVLFWSLVDHTGAVDGGSVDLSQPDLAASLTTLRNWLQKDSRPSDPRDVRPEPDNDIHVEEALTTAGDPYGEELLAPLSALLPTRLRELAIKRTSRDPLRVLFTLPAELSAVPWPIVPLSDDLRLVERIELQVLTPSAVRASAPRPSRRTTAQPVVLSCSNPDGELKDTPPVPGGTVLAGGASTPVTVAQFETAVRSARWNQGGTLFVRSHLGSSSGAPYVADRGILFSDGVLSARDLALTVSGGDPRMPLPNRTVLALCSGAAVGDASGLALGLAAACRLAGSEEVITSAFDIPDTSWGSKFDLRLAEAVSRPEPTVTTLRQLQLECLNEWQRASIDDDTHWDNMPHPLIWASFVVVR